jgi:hypothetical protein
LWIRVGYSSKGFKKAGLYRCVRRWTAYFIGHPFYQEIRPVCRVTFPWLLNISAMMQVVVRWSYLPNMQSSAIHKVCLEISIQNTAQHHQKFRQSTNSLYISQKNQLHKVKMRKKYKVQKKWNRKF